MMFLIRVAFWLSVVIILLPAGSQQPKAGPHIDTADAISAAGAAVADMRQFCARQPGACAVGAQAAVSFGYKAQAGAKMLYEFLTDSLAPVETGAITTASVGKYVSPGMFQNTLRPSDLTAAWRGPMPRPDPRREPTI
ncbi:MAG: DUF5330 domain-containing protein [Xanthobacteraceae bacterium]